MEIFEYIDVMNTPYQIYMEEVRDEAFMVKGHWHYFIEILYVTRGSIQVDCGKYRYHLAEGSVIVLPPKLLHRIQADGIFPSNYAVIKFDLNTIKIPGVYLPKIRRMLSDIHEKNPLIYLREQEENPFHVYIQNCLEEMEGRQFGYELNIYSNLSVMLIQMVRSREAGGTVLTEEKKEEGGSVFFANILEYIDIHSFEIIRVQDLAEKSGMSYSNFAKLFKKQYGRSCKEYIEYIRIAKAEELVLYSDFDISYIAQEVGFADTSHFIRIYKKFKEETPKQARLKAIG
ncbi:MAG: AraC family transcriptional regulator [Bacteroides sp.]|nr:AraC family transcriptional regulator [Bacteroides sp.]MCM1548984.1 AraC family transcriptional regulator [Clostridium sp.]